MAVDLTALRSRGAAWADRAARPVGVVLSLVLLVVVLRQAAGADWSALARSAGLSPLFWATLAAYYLLSPLAEWRIYSRLWGFDWGAFPALLRKLVCNELLLDYLGDVQLLAWARGRLGDPAAPFAAIKDVTILSALTGNLITIALVGAAWPYVHQALPGVPIQALLGSLCVIIAGSSVVLVLGKRIFSHRPRTLTWIAGMLGLRTLTSLGLSAALWYQLMPGTTVTQLFLLATFRMVISRLPLVPNKELLFAGLAVLLLGRGTDIAAATAVLATLVLLLHLSVGTVLTVLHVLSLRARRQAAPDAALPDP